MDRRLNQIRQVSDMQWRWDAYMSLIASGLVVRNFTELGFQVVDAPKPLYEKLKKELHNRMDHARYESKVDQIFSDNLCKFVDTGLNYEVLRELLPLHEEWAGVKLKPAISYGLRIYPNNSFLTMHTDRLDTHVISSILHIDRDQEEPWPLVIEDLHGKAHEVALEPGQLLFYESAKLLHGRPKRFNGKWYTSIFTHYYPADWQVTQQDVIQRIPHNWDRQVEDNGEPRLTIVGTGFLEHCKSHWCDLDGEGAEEVEDVQMIEQLVRQLKVADETRNKRKLTRDDL